MASNGLIGAIAQPTNDVAQAFGARSQQLDQQRQQRQQEEQRQQQQRDADFHKVVTYAGDGLVDEARYFAKQKGIEVPEAVYSNGVFAKGLSMAGNIYANDPEKANMFTQAFMSAQGDLNTRFQAGLQVAGKPVNADDREFANWVRKEQWKLKNNPTGGSGFTLSPGGRRYDAAGNLIAEAPAAPGESEDVEKYASKIYQDVYANHQKGDGMGGPIPKPEESDAVARAAADNYRRAFGGGASGAPAAPAAPAVPQGQISSGLTGGQMPTIQQPNLISESDLQLLIETARSQGYSDADIEEELRRRGIM